MARGKWCPRLNLAAAAASIPQNPVSSGCPLLLFVMKAPAHKFLALLLLVALSAATAGLARTNQYRPRTTRPLRREISAYCQATVLPVLRQQRQKLEPQLTATDRAQLAAYRTQLREVKAQGQVLRRSLRPGDGRTAQAAGPTDAQQQQLHYLRTQARRVMHNVAQMAQRYDAGADRGASGVLIA